MWQKANPPPRDLQSVESGIGSTVSYSTRGSPKIKGTVLKELPERFYKGGGNYQRTRLQMGSINDVLLLPRNKPGTGRAEGISLIEEKYLYINTDRPNKSI